jgi:hypothetical protein
MKRALGFSVLFLYLLVSCQKDEIIINPPEELLGSWEWLFTYMGWAPGPMNPLTPQNTGNTERIEFKNDFSWKSYINDIPVDSGTFRTGHGIYSPSEITTYVYDSIQYFRNGKMVKGMVDYYESENDTLIFAGFFRGLYGSGSRYYVKE